MLDIFDNDAFGLVSLTDAINLLPDAPTKVGNMNLFSDKPVRTTTIVIEEKEGLLQLVPNAARGTLPTASPYKDRNVRSFVCTHLPLIDTVQAEDSQNVRAFGTDDQLEAVSDLVADKLADMRVGIDTTMEWQRAKALQGLALDADGTTVIYNFFDEFGLTQTTVDFVMATTDDPKLKSMTVRRAIEDALGATMFTGITVLCSEGFFDALITAPDVKDAYDRWQESLFARSDPGLAGFEYSNIFWVEYRDNVGAVPFIPADEATAFPTGVPGLFRRYLAPADTMETVNTLGRPFYAMQESLQFNMGRQLLVQSNPLHVPTRPKCLINLTHS